MYVVNSSTLDLVGCTFLENSATHGNDLSFERSDDYNGSANIDGCPAGSSSGAETALDIAGEQNVAGGGGGIITGNRKSYSCSVCVR